MTIRPPSLIMAHQAPAAHVGGSEQLIELIIHRPETVLKGRDPGFEAADRRRGFIDVSHILSPRGHEKGRSTAAGDMCGSSVSISLATRR